MIDLYFDYLIIYAFGLDRGIYYYIYIDLKFIIYQTEIAEYNFRKYFRHKPLGG